MLPKHCRLVAQPDFSRCFSGQSFSFGPWLRFYVSPNNLSYGRLGLVISKKVSKSSVARHRLARVLREGFRQHCLFLSGFDIVVLLIGRNVSKARCLAIKVVTWQKDWEQLIKAVSD